ncbi:hypothetical protein COCSADRAFT_31689 [Bipolaris sorokiniana ND90Pr]|uniref:Uncharacterized protein n=1 Tax=Cochliobolus sativus (strain ND90Pr / ATCC 201652) TaxID=665912 RepID=M2SMB0_COCSN|nr:uncharacterized protein COCSADRAFT_31689 [Bipolaris sorokiniana ND90Pr]EMD58281.1 hypothetical protein COCSADRAFT_31689 [Bipolaris sorokiniana ND90Pr]
MKKSSPRNATPEIWNSIDRNTHIDYNFEHTLPTACMPALLTRLKMEHVSLGYTNPWDCTNTCWCTRILRDTCVNGFALLGGLAFSTGIIVPASLETDGASKLLDEVH